MACVRLRLLAGRVRRRKVRIAPVKPHLRCSLLWVWVRRLRIIDIKPRHANHDLLQYLLREHRALMMTKKPHDEWRLVIVVVIALRPG